MAFRVNVKIRFAHEDHARIVYYPRFFDFFHHAFEDMFEAHGTPYRTCLDVEHVGWPAVHVEADYRAPIRFGEVLVVDVWAERVGTTSVTFGYRGTRASDAAHVVDAKVVVACVDLRTFRPQEVPAKYRDMFAAVGGPPAPDLRGATRAE